MKNITRLIHFFVTTLAAALIPFSAYAGFRGDISFTDAERATHVRDIDTIERTAAACLQTDLEHHREFFRRYGISPFYGDRSSFSKLSLAERRALLSRLGVDPNLVSQMQPTSCVGMTLKCLGRGFAAAGESSLWNRVKAYTDLNDVDGMALQDALQKLGWRILYWNPDVTQNAAWDATERARNPRNSDHFWGEHQANWQSASRRGRYLYNRVDDARTLVNFGRGTPAALKSVPFFVGTAHMGYHVFPGTDGDVIEAHSTRAITDPKTLQSAPFDPLGGGGPTDGEYRSGLIAVPPGTI